MISYNDKIKGIEVNPPLNWQEQPILVDFKNDDPLAAFEGQGPSVDLGVLTFVDDGGSTFLNKSAKIIIDHAEGGIGGTNGLFEDIAYERFLNNAGNIVQFFNGYLDMETYRKIGPSKVQIEAKSFKDLNSLMVKIQANSFGFLEKLTQGSLGRISQLDYVKIPIIVESQDSEPMVYALSATIALLGIQFAQAVKSLSIDIANATAHTTGGVTGPVAGIAFTLASAVLNAVLITIIVVQLIRLTLDLLTIVIPPIAYTNAMLLRTLFEKASAFLGYTFVSPITELDIVAYLPSKPSSNVDTLTGVIASVTGFPFLESGVMRPDDPGYYIVDFFRIMATKYNGRFEIIGEELHFRSENDPFWKSNSVYKKRSIADRDVTSMDQKFEERTYNISEYKANTLISFATDASDTWTSSYFQGTNYEVVSRLQSESNPKLAKRGGLREINIPIALGNRKGELSEVEKSVQGISTVIIAGLNSIKNLGFPIPPNLTNALDISRRIGALRVSGRTYNVPKFVVIQKDNNGSYFIPPDHRLKLSAKVLWDKYWNYVSFVLNGFRGQKRVIKGERIPFNGIDFANVQRNNYFEQDGAEAKITRLEWFPDQDEAVIDYWIREVYCDKLEEIYIEPK